MYALEYTQKKSKYGNLGRKYRMSSKFRSRKRLQPVKMERTD